MTKDNRKFIEKYGKIEDMDRSFDIDFWQELGPEAIFKAAWELVEDAYAFNGKNLDELRLQRSVSEFGKLPR